MPGKILVIGLDGAEWTVLQPYLDKGVMPNLAHLIETGVKGPLRSTIPTQSPVAWSSFMTGQNPGKHGVFDFREPSPYNRLRMVSVNSRSIRSQTFMDILSKNNRRVGAINIPFSHPPFPLANGFLLTGMLIPKGATYTYPENFANELAENVGGFPINGMQWQLMTNNLESLIDEAITMTRQRARVLQYLIQHKQWDVLVQVFVSPDRLQHPLMHLLDPTHPHHDAKLAHQLEAKLTAYFSTIDEMLGQARHALGENGVLMLMSDHGFRSTDKLLNLKEVLQQFGFLRTNTYATARLTNRARLRRWLGPIRHWIPQSKKSPHKLGSVAEMGDIDWSNTRAYIRTAASQGIVINMKGREPHGIVAPGPESEALLQEIETRLLSLRDPETGEVVIKEVARGSELYQGDYTDNASDLLVIPADGYCQTEAEKGPHLMPLRMNTGIHSLDGIFVANGPGINQKATITGATLMDIAPTILYLSDVAIPRSMDGHVLDIFSNHCLTQQPPRYVELDSELEKQSYDYTEEEEQQLEEHLRSLGYL